MLPALGGLAPKGGWQVPGVRVCQTDVIISVASRRLAKQSTEVNRLLEQDPSDRYSECHRYLKPCEDNSCSPSLLFSLPL